MTGDPFGLQRFVDAQDSGGTYDQALRELRAGRKRGHWIWFVLPQVSGLGSSAMSELYAISGLDEARAYLAHPVLGPRLGGCIRALAGLDETDPVRVLGTNDAQKLRSSLTLFLATGPDDPDRADLQVVLDRWFGGEPDPLTTWLLGDGATADEGWVDDDDERAEVIASWWEYYRLASGTHEDRIFLERGPAHVVRAAVDAVDEVVLGGGRPALDLVVGLLRSARDDASLAWVAAGPLEDLVHEHGDEIATQLQELARREPLVALAMEHVAPRD